MKGTHSTPNREPQKHANGSRVLLRQTARRANDSLMNSRRTLLVLSGIVLLLTVVTVGAVTRSLRKEMRERDLFNDARQISSAAQQYYCENATSHCHLGNLIGPRGFISALSEGSTVRAVHTLPEAGAHALQPPYAQVAIALPMSPARAEPTKIFISRADYDTADSNSPRIRNPDFYPPGCQGLLFSAETGELLDAKGKPLPGGMPPPSPLLRAWNWVRKYLPR